MARRYHRAVHPVLAIAAHELGVPNVSGVVWRAARAVEVARRNPFSGEPIVVTDWQPEPIASPGSPAATLATCALESSVGWRQARTILAPFGGLKDGHLCELWMRVVGEDGAFAALARPSWVSADGSALLLAFPAEVTTRLAALTDSASTRFIERWLSDAPWLHRDADENTPEVARAVLDLVRPLATIAERNGGVVSAHVRAR